MINNRFSFSSCMIVSLILVVLIPSVVSAVDFQEVYDFSEKAVRLFEQGHLREAIAAAEQSYMLCKDHLNPDHPWTIASLQMLAELYRHDRRYDEAENLFKQFIQHQNSDLPSNLLNKATAMNNLAALYHEQNQLNKAESCYKEAFAIYQELLGSSHQYTKICLENLSTLNAEREY